MAKNYSKYSQQRKAIVQQVRRLEARGYSVPERYHLPTVSELKKMSPKDQNNVMRRAKGYTPAKVRVASKLIVTETTKKGNIVTKAISYARGRIRERREAAKKAVATRKATEHARKEYGLPKRYKVNPETGEVTEKKPRKTSAKSEEATEEEGYDDVVESENRRLFDEMKEEGRIDEDVDFDEWFNDQPDQPTGSSYIDSMEAYLQANGDTDSASFLREMYNRYYGADPEGFEERMGGENLPDLGDFYYEDSSGNVHYDVNAYIKLLKQMKDGPLSARESRKLSDVLKNG